MQGVHNPQERPQCPVCDPGLGLEGLVVKHCHPGGLTPGARGGGDGHQGLEAAGDGKTATDGSIDIVQELCPGVGAIQVGRLGGVHHAPAAHSKKCVQTLSLGKVSRVYEALVSGLDPDLVVEDIVDLTPDQGVQHLFDRGQASQVGVRVDPDLIK